MRKIIVTIIMLLIFTKVYAYENDYFKIEIPETYNKEDLKSKTEFRWSNNKKYLLIIVNDNKELKYDVEAYTDEDINNQKEYLETKMNEGLSKYNIKIEVTDIKKINKDETYYLEYDVFYPSKNITGYDMYQKGRMYTTNNYIITTLFSSDEKLDDNKEYEDIINTFSIKDTKVVNIDIKAYIITVIIIGFVLGIIGFLISNKKRK